MSQFSVKLYNSEYKELWDNFVSNAKNATFLFFRDFMDYHKERFDDYSLVVFKEGEIAAILPANKFGSSIYSHQGLSYGGLILNAKMKLKEVSIVFRELLKFLASETIEELHIKMFPTIYSKIPNDELDYLLFITKAKLERRDTLSVVNLDSKINFSKDRIAGCKRSKKQGLVVKEDNNFSRFWNDILIPNLKLKHDTNPVHSLKEITLLKERFPKNIRQFNVYNDDEIVAGTTIFESENVAHSQYISGNEDKNKLGSLDYLHAHLIENVFHDKAFFDFGISNENAGKNINAGLQYWKEGFGARTLKQDFYKIKTSNYKLLDTIWI